MGILRNKCGIFFFCLPVTIANSENKSTDPVNVFEIKQPLCVRFFVKYSIENHKFWIEQGINKKRITLGVFNYAVVNPQAKDKNKKDFPAFFSLKREYGNCKQTVDVFYETPSILKVKTINNKEPAEAHKSHNLYSILDAILNELPLRADSSPDYYKQENDIIFTKPGMEHLYKIYYALHGKYRIYNSLTYINEQVNLSMSKILTIFGVPVIYFHSGNGEEIFVYLGLHICPVTKKLYYAMLVIGFDMLNICRSLAYMIDRCSECHGSIESSMTTDDGLHFFRLDKN